MYRARLVVLLALVFTCGFAVQAALAQTAAAPAQRQAGGYPEAETALGWSYVHPDGGGPDSKLGGVAAVNFNLSSWFGIVVDASVNHFNGQFADGSGWGRTEYAVLGGTRFAFRQSGPVVPFAHLLVGYGRVNTDYAGTNSGDDFFVVQPGGGLDIGTGRFGARVEVSWRRLFDQTGGVNRLRVMAGLVIRSTPKRPWGMN